MTSVLFPILIAATVGLAIWGVARLAMGAGSQTKDRLRERLASDAVAGVAAGSSDSVLLQDFEATHGRSFAAALRRRVIQAFPEMTLARYARITAICAATVALLTLILTASLPLTLVGAAGGAYLPMIVVNSRRARRQRMIVSQLPEALDFLSRVLRAGHSLSTGLQMMGEELPEPMAGVFRQAYAQHSLGQSLEEAMKEMAQRIESSDFAFFVTAVLIQRQTGGDLAEVLKNISGMVRQRIRLQNHVKAITAEGRMTSYILVAFPAVLFVISYVMNPTYAGQLLQGQGLVLLGVSITLQFVGLMVIRRIVTVKV